MEVLDLAISRKKFVSMSSGNPVLQFLKQNRFYAFTRTEIADKIKMNVEDVSSKLRNLKATGKVYHKKPFWMSKR